MKKSSLALPCGETCGKDHEACGPSIKVCSLCFLSLQQQGPLKSSELSVHSLASLHLGKMTVTPYRVRLPLCVWLHLQFMWQVPAWSLPLAPACNWELAHQRQRVH